MATSRVSLSRQEGTVTLLQDDAGAIRLTSPTPLRVYFERARAIPIASLGQPRLGPPGRNGEECIRDR